MANNFLTRASAAVMVVSLFVVNAAAQDVATLRKNLYELENLSEKLKRAFPPTFTPDEQRALIERKARQASLQVTVKPDESPERVAFADGSPSPLSVAHIDLSARADHASVNFFLQMLDYTAQPVRIESATIKAASGATVSFTARVAIAFYGPAVAADTPSPTRDPVADLRQRIARQRAFIDLMLDVHENGNARSFSEAVASLSQGAGNEAISLTEIRLGDEVTFEGEVAGARARSILNDAFSKAPLSLTSLTYAPDRLCRHFLAKAKLPPRRELGADAESEESGPVILGNGLFTTSSCGSDTGRTSAKPITVRGNSPKGVTLMLRDGSASDLFRVLHDAAAEDFVVGAIPGRITVDVRDASIEEMLAALREAGMVIGPPPLRTVTARGDSPVDHSQEMTGEKISLLLSSASLRDVLCLFSNITGLPIAVDPATEKRITIFATDVEWDRALLGILSVHGLQYRIDGNRALIAVNEKALASPALADPCTTTGPAENDRFSSLTVEKLDGSDLELAGTARVDGSWRGYVRIPHGRLLALDVGQKLANGSVEAIDSNGLMLSTKQAIGFEK